MAVFGLGGLGYSAVQIALAYGASPVFGVDIDKERLEKAVELGAVPIDANLGDPVETIKSLNDGKGVNVALDLVGLPQTMSQSVQVLGIQGRSVVVGLANKRFDVDPYNDLLNKEAEIIGCSDHLASEIPELIGFAESGKLKLDNAITETVPLDAGAINATLDRLDQFGGGLRTVIVP